MKKQGKVTGKGQVTVPREIRRRLGVRAGDRLLFEEDGGGVRITAVRDKSPFEKYRGIGTPGIGKGRKGLQKWLRELRANDNSRGQQRGPGAPWQARVERAGPFFGDKPTEETPPSKIEGGARDTFEAMTSPQFSQNDAAAKSVLPDR